jgi:hypothetical protein
MPITTISVSNHSPIMEDFLDVEVVDTDGPGNVVLEAEITDLKGFPKKRSFVLQPRPPAIPNTYYKVIHGWELGQFSLQDVKWKAYSDVPNFLQQIINMEVRGTNNPFSPVVQYLIQWIKNDPVLATFIKPDQVKRVRKNKQYRPQTPAFYVYTDTTTPQGRQGTAKLAYENRVYIEYLEPVTKQREQDENRHEIFLQRVSEHISNFSQLDPNLGVSVAFPRRGNIPHNTFSYQFSIVSRLEIFVRITPDYPSPVVSP